MLEFFSHHHLILLVFLWLAAFTSGFVDAIAGGGGLIAMPALMLSGLPINMVVGTSKLQGVGSLVTSVWTYARHGLISFSTVYRGLIMGFIGAVLGAVMANKISNDFLRYVIPVLLLLVFIMNILNKKLGIEADRPKMKTTVFFAVFGFIFGFYDAFFGPGVGNFWVMAIVYFLGYTFMQASGYAKVLNLKSNIIALAIFIYYGTIDYHVAGVMITGQLLGGFIGSKTVIKFGSGFIRPFFMTIVLFNLVILFYQLFSGSRITLA